MKRLSTLVTAAVIIPLALSACGGSGDKPAASSTSGAATTTAPIATSSAPMTTSAPATTTAEAKLDANKASEEDMVKAFINAGMKEANAKKWADEVKEYRPYTKANLASTITSKLAKYKVPPADMAIIMKTLEVK